MCYEFNIKGRFFIPDVEARVFGDRIYLYGSSDVEHNLDYCSDDYYVFSSSDMLDWKCEGKSFTSLDAHTAQQQVRVLFAPDCIYKDGQYHLFYCQPGGAEGVATSKKPQALFAMQGR